MDTQVILILNFHLEIMVLVVVLVLQQYKGRVITGATLASSKIFLISSSDGTNTPTEKINEYDGSCFKSTNWHRFNTGKA